MSPSIEHLLMWSLQRQMSVCLVRFSPFLPLTVCELMRENANGLPLGDTFNTWWPHLSRISQQHMRLRGQTIFQWNQDLLQNTAVTILETLNETGCWDYMYCDTAHCTVAACGFFRHPWKHLSPFIKTKKTIDPTDPQVKHTVDDVWYNHSWVNHPATINDFI